MNNKNVSSHCHYGHRKRLRQLIDKAGLSALSDVQIVEQILTMTHARCDTNEIAHRLLSKFGSISKILDASTKSLQQVEGVGEVTAKMITYLPQIFEIYNKDKNKKKYKCKTNGDIYNFYKQQFANCNEEIFVITYLNNNFYVQETETLSVGDFASVKVKRLDLTKSLANHDSNMIIVGHNHPYGSATPSMADYDAFNQLCELFTVLGIKIVDIVIIGEDGMYSNNNKCVLTF